MEEIASVIKDKLDLLYFGVAKNPTLRQSDCVVFLSGKMYTFSGDVFAITSYDVGFDGAVNYNLLREILAKHENKKVKINKVEEALKIDCGRSHSKIAIDSAIVLSVSMLSQPDPNKWVVIPDAFVSAIKQCETVVRQDRVDDVLASINIELDKVEACNTAQLLRIYINSPFDRRFLVRGGILGKLFNANVTKMQISGNWLFLANDDVTYATPIYDDAFIDLESYFQSDAPTIKLPKEELLSELENCAVMCDKGDLLGVELDSDSGILKLLASTKKGKCSSEIPMNLPMSMKFKAGVPILRKVFSEYDQISITPGAIHVDQPTLSYAVSIESVE